jgi:hypothetical protein
MKQCLPFNMQIRYQSSAKWFSGPAVCNRVHCVQITTSFKHHVTNQIWDEYFSWVQQMFFQATHGWWVESFGGLSLSMTNVLCSVTWDGLDQLTIYIHVAIIIYNVQERDFGSKKGCGLYINALLQVI